MIEQTLYRYETKRRKLHFTESMKTYFSRKNWFYFIIFKYFVGNSKKNSINFHST